MFPLHNTIHNLQLIGAALAGQIFVGMVAYYDSAITFSTASVYLQSLHGCMLDFMHLLTMNVAEITHHINLKRCPLIFAHVYCSI